MARLWTVWLTVWCWGVIAFGALLATAAIPALDDAAHWLFGVFANNPSNAAMFEHPAVRFGLGLQGALSIGWGLTMLALLDVAKSQGAPLWRALTTSLLVWYAIDSAISVSTGFWINAISNTALMMAFMIPMFASGALQRPRAA